MSALYTFSMYKRKCEQKTGAAIECVHIQRMRNETSFLVLMYTMSGKTTE